MKTLIFILIASPIFSAQAALLNCEYSMTGAPLGTVRLSVDENGRPADMAEVSLFFAPMRKVPVTQVDAGTGELLRLYLSKDDPSNELLMTVKTPEGDSMKSVLFNASAPGGAKELRGVCKF